MEQKKLVECLSVKSKNLDFIKFVASILVIYSHAYDICGYSEREVIKIFSGGGTNIRWSCGGIFFICEWLICYKELKKFYNKRIYKKENSSNISLFHNCNIVDSICDRSFSDYVGFENLFYIF